MIDPTSLANLTPAKRAEVIYNQARAEVNAKLWQVALGSNDDNAGAQTAFPLGSNNRGSSLGALMSLLFPDTAGEVPAAGEPEAVDAVDTTDPTISAERVFMAPSGETNLGRNARFQSMIEGAAARVGVPATALAAIVDAEAGKSAGGEWNPFSRNPRSSAAGLGQFLAGTWVSEAEKPGNWLHSVAQQQGWLDDRGKVLSSARHQLLALRYDARASIEATADYARNNMAYLEKSGVSIGSSAGSISHAAYIAHHLGVGDAVRFLRSAIPEDRAKVLLAAQIGPTQAAERINRAGSATLAHREWLSGYVARQVRPQRFATIA